MAADQLIAMVGSIEARPTAWSVETRPLTVPGATVSIQNGPRWTVGPQLPAVSLARTWIHQWLPSGELLPVKVAAGLRRGAGRLGRCRLVVFDRVAGDAVGVGRAAEAEVDAVVVRPGRDGVSSSSSRPDRPAGSCRRSTGRRGSPRRCCRRGRRRRRGRTSCRRRACRCSRRGRQSSCRGSSRVGLASKA